MLSMHFGGAGSPKSAETHLWILALYPGPVLLRGFCELM